MEVTISIGQMNVYAGQPGHNLAGVESWVIEAARRGSDLVVFPELWDTGYALDRAAELATPVTEGRFSIVADFARQHKIHIVGSMLEHTPEGQTFNTAIWFSPNGSLGRYRKTHLFRLMDEDRYLQPGCEPLLLDLPWGKTAVAICYDLRFPELFRHYALGGAVMTIMPSEWPAARIEHWRTLLRARAIENQMVIVGCNRVGADEDTPFGGRSIVLDAWGEPLIEGGGEEALLTVAVDLSQVEQVRRRIPVFKDRRPDVYNLS